MENNLEEDKIKTLYLNGLVNLNNIFDQDLLKKIRSAKDKLFKDFPYGQDDDLQKKTAGDFVRPGSYMIWDVIEREPIFSKILENKAIQNLSKRVLGENYTVASFYIRKTPKINSKLNPHIDYQGGLSFSILLDDISLNQGETFFYEQSHKFPPPPFANTKKSFFKKGPTSITGKVGDTFFWFPDCWHGRNVNETNKDTTILMCHMGNLNHPNKDSTGRKVGYSNKQSATENKQKNEVLNRLFKFCGNSPNNVFTHFFYCLIYFKFSKLSKIAIEQRLIFTRNKYGDEAVDNFSITKYLGLIKFSKAIVITAKKLIKSIVGEKGLSLIRKAFK